jgi:hypothetical protein
MKKLFVGKEAEGIYKGVRTLFVVGNQNYLTVADTAIKNDVQQIYLGACKSDSIEMSLSMLPFCDEYIVTMEIELGALGSVPTAILGKIRLLIRIESQQDLSMLDPLDMIKVDTGKNCFIVPVCQMIKNELIYVNDEEVS